NRSLLSRAQAPRLFAVITASLAIVPPARQLNVLAIASSRAPDHTANSIIVRCRRNCVAAPPRLLWALCPSLLSLLPLALCEDASAPLVATRSCRNQCILPRNHTLPAT